MLAVFAALTLLALAGPASGMRPKDPYEREASLVASGEEDWTRPSSELSLDANATADDPAKALAEYVDFMTNVMGVTDLTNPHNGYTAGGVFDDILKMKEAFATAYKIASEESSNPLNSFTRLLGLYLAFSSMEMVVVNWADRIHYLAECLADPERRGTASTESFKLWYDILVGTFGPLKLPLESGVCFGDSHNPNAPGFRTLLVSSTVQTDDGGWATVWEPHQSVLTYPLILLAAYKPKFDAMLDDPRFTKSKDTEPRHDGVPGFVYPRIEIRTRRASEKYLDEQEQERIKTRTQTPIINRYTGLYMDFTEELRALAQRVEPHMDTFSIHYGPKKDSTPLKIVNAYIHACDTVNPTRHDGDFDPRHYDEWATVKISGVFNKRSYLKDPLTAWLANVAKWAEDPTSDSPGTVLGDGGSPGIGSYFN